MYIYMYIYISMYVYIYMYMNIYICHAPATQRTTKGVREQPLSE